MKNYRVLFIGGSGRSGSTLLDLILGSSPDCVSVGEVKHFFDYFSEKNIRCGCGQLLVDCSFWNDVVRAAGFTQADINNASRLNRVNRTRNFFWIANHQQSDPGLITLSQYFRRLYTTILDLTEKSILIDNSKSPSHLILIRRNSPLVFHLLHLLRHPVAVGYAWNERTKNDPAVEGTYMQKRAIFPSMIRWALENELIAQQKDWVTSYHRIRYEDLVDAAQTRLEEAMITLELPEIAKQVVKVLQSTSIHRTHSIGGNPIRFFNGNLKIKADNKWQSGIPDWKINVLELAIFPWLRKFGY